MADTENKVQLGILLSREGNKLLRNLHARYQADQGPVSLSLYVERLIREEGKRQESPRKRQGRG